MATSITSSSTYIPGPPFTIDLAPLDARHPEHYSCRLLIFRASPSQHALQLSSLKSGLRTLVHNYPFLGGKVIPDPKDPTCSTIVPDRGIELIVRDLRSTLPSFSKLETENFQTSLLKEELLVPISEDLGNLGAACKVQFSAIEGGTIVGWTISHRVGDGNASNVMISALAEAVRDAQEKNRQVGAVEGEVECMDRALLRNITSDVPFKIEDHVAYGPGKSISEEWGALRQSYEAKGLEIPILLHILKERLVQLKNDVKPENVDLVLSTHDLLVALIWRSTILIRSRRSSTKLPDTTLVRLFMPSDCRRHLGLDPNYIGNAVYQLKAQISLGNILSSSGLLHAASAIRHAIKAVTPELVASNMAELKSKWIEWGFMDGSISTTGVAMGTDWTSTSMYSDDWGEAFGEVVSYRYPGSEGGGFCCAYPKLRDGGAEVMVAVMEDEVEFLKGEECFGKYLRSD